MLILPCLIGRQTWTVREGGHSSLPGGRHGRVRDRYPILYPVFARPRVGLPPLPFSRRTHARMLNPRCCSKLGGQALVLDVEGTWRELTGVVNKLAANLTNQVRSIAKVTKAVELGDLSKQIEVDARGEILEVKNTVNGMVGRLRALSAEVTRVTMEVGSKGQLGGQAHVPDVEGVWLELTRNVSSAIQYVS